MVNLCFCQNNEVFGVHLLTINAMKNLLVTLLLAVAFGFTSNFTHAQDSTYTVKVIVKGITEAKGFVAATITDNPEGFPKVQNPVATAKVAITEKGNVELTFKNIKPGKYAVILMHDVNSNGELDMNGAMPAEPFGFSNITMFFGPPLFSDAAFEVSKDTTIEISLVSF